VRVADPRGRAALAAVALAVALAAAIPAVVVAHDPPGTDRFMHALGQVESNGRYDARNAVSGAYGKYQIMPANWPRWAARYLGDRDARPTAMNQEVVAHGKLHDLYHWLGSWRQVAYWWLAGRDGREITWSSFATRYVAKVMAAYRGDAAWEPLPRLVVQDRSPTIAYRGGWSSATHRGYADGRVRWARARGATATLRFAGSSVAWVGPVGPTRGRAIVSLDGRVVRTVDLGASRFVARRTLFTRTFPVSGPHTLTITVAGTSGRPVVAIDAFVVRP
jgi:Transglycosylase-like domain